jgi:chromosome partitioning protein
MNAGFYALKEIIQRIKGFDFILIDTQPSKNILMLNAFISSNFVLIPTNPSVYPLMDIVELEEAIRQTSKNSNPELMIIGVLITMVQRATVYKQLENDLREYFGNKVFTTMISRTAKSEESAVEGIGVTAFDPQCKLAIEYKNFTAELLERLLCKAV